MKDAPLIRGSIIRTAFVMIEMVALVVVSVITFLNDGTSAWGYWGNVAIVFITFSPIFVYVIASTIFNFFNMVIVLKKRHTVESIKKYYKMSKLYFILGIVTGGLYGCLLIPIFLLENVFLLNEYKKELEKTKNT